MSSYFPSGQPVMGMYNQQAMGQQIPHGFPNAQPQQPQQQPQQQPLPVQAFPQAAMVSTTIPAASNGMGSAAVAGGAAAPSNAFSSSVVSSSPFALIIPGRLVDTSFRAIDPKKMVLTLSQPALVQEFTVAMLQPAVPQGLGVAVYYSLPPFTGWDYVGPLSLDYPTAVFRAPWREKIPADTPAVQIGLSVEEISSLKQMQPADQKEEERTLESAKGIAQDLYTFMASFAQSTGNAKQFGGMLVIPTNCIDKWYEKFLAKHKREPYFWLKKQ